MSGAKAMIEKFGPTDTWRKFHCYRGRRRFIVSESQPGMSGKDGRSDGRASGVFKDLQHEKCIRFVFDGKQHRKMRECWE